MKPAPFSYHAPETVAEAIALLGRLDDAKVIAGGQSLLPMLTMRIAQPQALVALEQVGDLDYIRRDGDAIAIGAMTRQRTLELDRLVAKELPALPPVLRHVAHVAIRHRGTIGGSIVHAHPAAELPLAAATLGAELVVEGPGGRRTIAADRFFVTYLTAAIAPDELLVEVRLPRHEGAHVGFEQLARRHGDFAVAAVLAVLERDAAGAIAAARVGAGGVHQVPLRVPAAEQALVGTRGEPEALAAAAAAVGDAVSPPSDVHGSAAYRRRVVGVLARRALAAAVAQADTTDREPRP